MTLDPRLQQLPGGVADAVESQLEIGERVRWADRPHIPGRRVWVWVLVLMSPVLVLVLLTRFWAVAGPAVVLPLQARAFEALILLVGLTLVLAPGVIAWVVCHTAYIVTDRRAMIIYPWPWQSRPRSFVPQELRGLRWRELPDGSGDVLLDGKHAQRGFWDFPAHASFVAVKDVATVRKLLEQLARLR